MNLLLDAILLGLGLSMDTAAIGMADGLRESNMRLGKTALIALAFGLTQGLMPLVGYFAGSLFTQWIGRFVPYIGFAILLFLGVKMIVEGCRRGKDDAPPPVLTARVVFVQALATSVDALTVGVLYIANPLAQAAIAFSIIAGVTFVIAFAGVLIGRAVGSRLSRPAQIVGGVLLIGVGIKILVEALLAL